MSAGDEALELGVFADLWASAAQSDTAAAAVVAARAADSLRPSGALARLDAVAVWLAGWQRTSQPCVERPAVVVFAGDHGVAADGVSAYPTEVTAGMLAACRAGRATINALARSAGATFEVVDVGVGVPTANLRHEPAMSPERFAASVAAGRQAIAGLDTDLLVLGELGIGNTTAAAAVAGCVLGGDARSWVGRGTGVDDAGLAAKAAAVADAQARTAGTGSPIEVARHVGGTELAAIMGAVAEARRRSIPVVLDGFIATAAALPLHAARPGWLDHCVAGHCSAEPGHRRLLDAIGLDPLISLDLRLGEGSGAVLAVPIVRMAAAAVVEVATMTEWFGG